MKTEIKTAPNGKNYTVVTSDNDTVLMDSYSGTSLGSEVAIGIDYRDRKTGEVLKTPIALKPSDIIQAIDYEYAAEDTNHVFNAGDLVLRDGNIYKVKLTHFGYQETVDNFNTFYQLVISLKDAESGVVPDFIQPTGAHDAYKKGDKVTFNGKVWESLIDSNVWSPTAYPAGWKLIN